MKIFDVEKSPLNQHLAKCDLIVSINDIDISNYTFNQFAELIAEVRHMEKIELTVLKDRE